MPSIDDLLSSLPDKSWSSVSTYPYHFHNSSQNNIEASPFHLTAIDGFQAFMEFVRDMVRKRERAAYKKGRR